MTIVTRAPRGKIIGKRVKVDEKDTVKELVTLATGEDIEDIKTGEHILVKKDCGEYFYYNGSFDTVKYDDVLAIVEY